MNQEPWQWDEPTWRGHIGKVRAGRSLTPDQWPGGARVAVAISFDSDHETIPLRDGETSPGKLAQGEYGARVAAPKIVRLLGEYDVPASFFMPAVSALLHPEEVEAYVAGGHEVAVHGWIHERNMLLGRDDELDLTGRALDTLERLSGARPTGIRTPSWDFSENTLSVIRELGFVYDSSLMADDEPYELVAEGQPTGIVEIPVEWIRDDAPYFMMERYASLRPYMPPRSALQIWIDEFDAARAEGGLFQLTLHPHIIGHRSRLVVLRALLDHISQHGDVWYGTHAQIADLLRPSISRVNREETA
ncbi:polysaccharide deacetylase [Micromonospora sp. 4G57]|uniref:Polysaccharide deacetylase n=1 Tax=Micromonospora sicca TaxID=2202420 RepID=A0ABU5JM00_9ACTN|nr:MULTISPECIES: polysaccharide deacetylase [unclassified Micromonospora]MDZ5446985.1 polysaccharide deacetylase [Micromonospora sp. 4G57]MDZ5493662.1 polysaccharide deacetylase [Micromonospora sp. 4G53]